MADKKRVKLKRIRNGVTERWGLSVEFFPSFSSVNYQSELLKGSLKGLLCGYSFHRHKCCMETEVKTIEINEISSQHSHEFLIGSFCLGKVPQALEAQRVGFLTFFSFGLSGLENLLLHTFKSKTGSKLFYKI